MSYRKVYLEWAIGENNLLSNVPVGFEVEFSRDRSFSAITTKFTTFDEGNPYGAHLFSYSVDYGNTWNIYPWGDAGKTFTAPFRMRLEITPAQLGYALSFYGGSLKKISADSRAVIDSTTLVFEDIKDVDQYEDVLYLVGEETLYKVDGRTLGPYDNSLPLLTDNAIGVVADESRETLWQINQNTVWLRSIYGDVLWSASIPEIDIEASSSSSSSSTSSSSSSSFGYTSSSSSSSSLGYTSSSSSSGYIGIQVVDGGIQVVDGGIIVIDGPFSSSSSESEGNVSSSSSSSESDSSLDEPSMYATGFDAFPILRGTYYAVSYSDIYLTYKNLNGCFLQHDPYGVTRWKLYIDETNRQLARDHYYKNTETADPYTNAPDNYGIHMWWDIGNIPSTGLIGTISDTP